jgi:hypothetical protein
MDLVRLELSVGLKKGIILGVYQEDFMDDKAFERDINICLGLFVITLTLIYN